VIYLHQARLRTTSLQTHQRKFRKSHNNGSYADNNISDKEFVPLYDCYCSKNPDFSYQSHDFFDQENMNSADCKAEFQNEKAHLPHLADGLQIPAVFHCKQISICDGFVGLCVQLMISDMIQHFPVAVFNLITNEVMDYVYDNHCGVPENIHTTSWRFFFQFEPPPPPPRIFRSRGLHVTPCLSDSSVISLIMICHLFTSLENHLCLCTNLRQCISQSSLPSGDAV